MMPIRRFLIAALALTCASLTHADTYTYTYVGPKLGIIADHLVISFTTNAPLLPNRSYVSTASAGVMSGAVTLVNASGAVVPGFTLPLSTFQIRTAATASASVPGILAWDILGDTSTTLSGTAPTMTGSHFQAYSMNTLNYIPGSDLTPLPQGLVTGPYDYDQATETSFYSSCSGVQGCTLAGNGQPYVSNFGGLINPSSTSAANWTINHQVTTPVPSAALVLSGSLPADTVGNAYSGSLTASGGTPPYVWHATGLPAGLTMSASTGLISGTPTIAGSAMVSISVKDNSAQTHVVTKAVNLYIASAIGGCTTPTAAHAAQGKNTITQIGSGQLIIGKIVVQVPGCARVLWGRASSFKVGQKVEYEGYISPSTGVVATKIAID